MTWSELWKKLKAYKFDPFWDTIMIAAAVVLSVGMCWWTGNWWPGLLQNAMLFILGVMVVYWFF